MKPTEFEASRKIQFFQLKGIFPCLESYEIDIQIDTLSEAEPANLLKESWKYKFIDGTIDCLKTKFKQTFWKLT